MEEENFTTLGWRVWIRFWRGALGGAISNMVVVQSVTYGTMGELANWGFALLFAGITGAVTGGLMAADKAIRG